tara:strand:- start:425 stop:526 length:102 start_codon:yes stop_codon:yes gene_type:complete
MALYPPALTGSGLNALLRECSKRTIASKANAKI